MRHQTRSSLVISGITGAVMFIGAGLLDAHAQQQPQPPMPPELSKNQIETFADAAIDVQRIEQDFNAQVQGAQDAQEVDRLHQQAQQEARQAIQDKGLSVEEYTAIVQAANQDPQLYAMLVEAIQQRAAQ